MVKGENKRNGFRLSKCKLLGFSYCNLKHVFLTGDLIKASCERAMKAALQLNRYYTDPDIPRPQSLRYYSSDI